MRSAKIHLLLLSVLTSWPTGCGGSMGGNPEKTGNISFKIVDSPVDDAKSVFVTVKAIEVRKAEGEWLTISIEPEEFDLLALRNGKSRTLSEGFTLEPGVYSETRLILADADPRFVDKSGVTHELKIPSGEESGLKIKSEFEVPAEGKASITFDFDLRKSIHSAGNSGKYLMRPVIRLVDDALSGRILGTASESQTICLYSLTQEPEATCENAIASTKPESDQNFVLTPIVAGDYKLIFVENEAIVRTVNDIKVEAGKDTSVPQD